MASIKKLTAQNFLPEFSIFLRKVKNRVFIKSDELWHFYGGDSLVVVEITKEGALKETRLDKNHVQYVVPAGVWFGAYLPEGSEYSFTGCSVAPAFHFADLEMGIKAKMLIEFPMAKVMIEKLLS